MEKRGQAAMEFLMTYGWAILAAIIAIAVLAYFGVFNPGRYASEVCSLGPPYICSEQSAAYGAGDGYITLVLTNSGDESVSVTEVAITNCAVEDYSATPVVIGSGADSSFQIDCTNANNIDPGDSFRGNIEVTYKKPTTADRPLTATGSITRKSAQ